jgi:hypothetical protein
MKEIEWTIDDVISELRRISLVSEPAHQEDFLLFRSVEINFKTLDEEKRIVTGPAMRPDIKILRKDDAGEFYKGSFSKETVRKAAELFFKTGSNLNMTNLEHEWEISGVYVFESWIVEDPEMDKSKYLGFKNVSAGDWFVSMKVENEDVWRNYLKTGIIKGFSVEIKAKETPVNTIDTMKEIMMSDIDDLDKIELLKEITLTDIFRLSSSQSNGLKES